MVNVCSFVHCKNRVRKNDKRFYRIPAEITRSDEKTKKLSQKRRKKWLAMLRREDIESCFSKINNARICNDHFISGKQKNGIFILILY